MTVKKGRKADPAVTERNENIYRFIMRHGLSAKIIKMAAIEFEVSDASARMAFRAKEKYYKHEMHNKIRVLDLRGFTKEGIALNLKISHKEVNDALRKVKSEKARVPKSLMLWV